MKISVKTDQIDFSIELADSTPLDQIFKIIEGVLGEKSLPLVHKGEIPTNTPIPVSIGMPIIKTLPYIVENTQQLCMHEQCTQCNGTGVKRTGGMCIHMMSCPCPKCSPTYSTGG